LFRQWAERQIRSRPIVDERAMPGPIEMAIPQSVGGRPPVDAHDARLPLRSGRRGSWALAIKLVLVLLIGGAASCLFTEGRLTVSRSQLAIAIAIASGVGAASLAQSPPRHSARRQANRVSVSPKDDPMYDRWVDPFT